MLRCCAYSQYCFKPPMLTFVYPYNIGVICVMNQWKSPIFALMGTLPLLPAAKERMELTRLGCTQMPKVYRIALGYERCLSGKKPDFALLTDKGGVNKLRRLLGSGVGVSKNSCRALTIR